MASFSFTPNSESTFSNLFQLLTLSSSSSGASLAWYLEFRSFNFFFCFSASLPLSLPPGGHLGGGSCGDVGSSGRAGSLVAIVGYLSEAGKGASEIGE